MPLDPSIILGVRPPQIQAQDPIEQYSKAATLKALMGQGQLQDRQIEDDAAVRDAYKASNGDSKVLRSLLGERGQYKAIQTLDKFELDNAEKKAGIAVKQQELTTKAVAMHRDSLANVNDPQAAAQWVQAGYTDPLLAPILNKGGDVQTALSRIPQDPQAFQAWKQQNALGATKFIELNKPQVHVRDLGGTSEVFSTPGLGGTPQTLSTTAKTQSPDSMAADARARESQQIERVKADPFGVLGLNKNPAATASAGAGLSGEEYLKTLAPGIASQVKALAEGKLAITPRTLQSPQGSALLQMAMQYEPGTDQTVYMSRQATARDAANGKLATSNNALNTVAGHLAGLADSADKLNNTSFPWANKVKNVISQAAGNPEVNAFNLNLMGVADELERAYRGAGGAASQIEQWKHTLGDSSSPEQFKAVLAKGAEMLESKLEANHAQYVQGMHGKPGDFRTITPKTEQALAKLRGVEKAAPAADPTKMSDAEIKKALGLP